LLGASVLCAVAFAQAAHGEIFKCLDAQNKVTYQQRPCDGAAKESGVAVETAPQGINPAATGGKAARSGSPVMGTAGIGSQAGTVKSVQSPGASSSRLQVSQPQQAATTASSSGPNLDLGIALILVTKPLCDRSPVFARETRADYAHWRERNAQKIAATEASAGYRSWRDQALKNQDSIPPNPEPDKTCLEIAHYLDAEGGAADPRLATAEGTWRVFTAAARTGDEATALKCMAGEERQMLMARYPELKSTLRAWADRIQNLGIGTEKDSMRIGRYKMQDGSDGSVVFARLGDNWRIVGLIR
jgi:Domain of unknown function (DUF4124)